MFDKRINIIRLVLGVMAFGLGFLCNRIVGIVLETNPQIVATDIANTKALAVRQKRFLKSGSLYDYKQLEDYYDALDISGDEMMLYHIIAANKFNIKNSYANVAIKIEYMFDKEMDFPTKLLLNNISMDFLIRGGMQGIIGCDYILYDMKDNGGIDFYDNKADSLAQSIITAARK